MPEKIVIFMGAGASKPFGIPLTREILPKMLEAINDRGRKGAKDKRGLFVEIPDGDVSAEERKKMEKELLNFLYLLMPGLEERFNAYKEASADKKKEISFPLITELLSLVDHLNINNNVPFFRDDKIYSAKGLSYYRKLLDRAIYEILADDDEYLKDEKNKLDAFVKYISSFINEGKQVSLITTNYDTTVETEIYESNIKRIENIDFGFSWRHAERDDATPLYQPKSTLLKILKLHGSLNWLKCDLCDHVYINPRGNIIHQSFRSDIDELNSCHCSNAPLKSLIVAPSFERDVRDSNLLHVWKTALETLRAADKWMIIGYSLPPEDLAIKSLLIRAKNSRSSPLEKKNFTVIQHGEAAKDAYSLLFGQNQFDYISNGMDGFLGTEGP
jgi:NAD-dependent SIR2 family protein deacetylase